MIRENEFVEYALALPELSKKTVMDIRMIYRSMPKKEKRRLDRGYVKSKKSLPFKSWWNVIGENVKNGIEKHKNNSDNFVRVHYT